MTSRERVQTVLCGGVPDRPPLFDLLRNNAVIEYYSGLSLADDPVEAVYTAIRNTLDSTRSIRLPDQPGEEHLENGRLVVRRQWTVWTVHESHPTVTEAEEDLKTLIRNLETHLADDIRIRSEVDTLRSSIENHLSRLGPHFAYFTSSWGIGMMLYTRYGLETFSYLLSDSPELIARYLMLNTELSLRHIALLSIADLVVGVFIGDDIAYKGTTIFSPDYLRREFFPRLEVLVDAYHTSGLPVMFHSDGNLMNILSDLVACGIDLLNPIEVAAGMNPLEIRDRHPRLILVGGIDVSELLPFGTPDQVAEATLALIQTTGPGVLVGSSTELHNEVPLENFQAMVETVRQYQYWHKL